MYFNEILKQVSKPSRYIPIEKNPYKKEDDLYKIALVNAGNYESSITSLFFQSLYALVIDSKKYTPFRFFKPDNDYLSLVIEEKKAYKSIDGDLEFNECNMVFAYLNGDDAHFDFSVLNHAFPTSSYKVIFQESNVVNPLIKAQADIICIGNDPFKLKTLLKNHSIDELKAKFSELSEDKCIFLDQLNGFGSITKFISPLIDVKNSNNKYSYLYHALEHQTADIFQEKAKPWEAILQNGRKRLNQMVENIPNENEISLFPMGISNRIRQFLNVQSTYLNVFESIKTLLAQGWRHIHLYFWIGHPIEDHSDWREFREQLSQIEHLVENFKKINVSLHISPFVPSIRSPFLWDDVIDPETYKTTQEKLHRFLSERPHITATFEPFSAYFMRLFALRGNKELAEKLTHYIGSYVSVLPLESTEQFVLNIMKDEPNFSTIFQAQAFERDFFNSSIELDIEALKKERQTISKQLAEGKDKTTGELNINALKRAAFNHNIHLSKTLDAASDALGTTEIVYGRSSKLRAAQQQDVIRKYRVMFSKTDHFRFYSHIEVRNIILKAFSEAKIPVSYSKGFTPLPKIAFGMTASTGISSLMEFFDVDINSIKTVDLVTLMQEYLPKGLTFISAKEIQAKEASLASAITLHEYTLDFSRVELEPIIIENWLNQPIIKLVRETKNSIQELNLKEFIDHYELNEHSLTLRCKKVEDRILKIEEFLSSLNQEFPFNYHSVDVIRINQFIKTKDGNLTSPMDV